MPQRTTSSPSGTRSTRMRSTVSGRAVPLSGSGLLTPYSAPTCACSFQKGDGQAGAYVWTRVRVTGPVRGRLSGCRFWYRQGAVEFRQDVGCETVLRLGPSVR